jgi:hypothetical protein
MADLDILKMEAAGSSKTLITFYETMALQSRIFIFITTRIFSLTDYRLLSSKFSTHYFMQNFMLNTSILL